MNSEKEGTGIIRLFSKAVRYSAINVNTWTVSSTLLILLVAAPIVFIFVGMFSPVNDNWHHIVSYLLQDYIINSLLLVIGTGIITIIIGVATAWFIAVYDFPLRSLLSNLLILPLAVPSYIAAYTYTGFLSYTGPLQVLLRRFFDFKGPAVLFNLMSLPGSIFIFSITLYPYVYLIVKAFLSRQSATMIEAGRSLGRNMSEVFFYIVLPLCRTAIVGGVSLVILEVLNDYGVVKYFGVPTFSTAIFKTWLALGDTGTAVKLAAILLSFAFTMLILEKFMRGHKKYTFSSRSNRPLKRIPLKGWKLIAVLILVLLPFLLGFALPFIQLVRWALMTYRHSVPWDFIMPAFNTLTVSLTATGIMLIVSIILANTVRIHNTVFSKIYSKIAVMGYAIPGAVIAVGVLILFIALDNTLYPLYTVFDPNASRLLLSGSLVLLIFAYCVRFLSIAYNAVETGFEKMGISYFEASRSLGNTISQTFIRVDLPLLRPALFSGAILAFIDIVKELPLTLILRPFNFNTLATKAYEYADDEMIHEASISSLVIIIICIVAIFLFTKISGGKKK